MIYMILSMTGDNAIGKYYPDTQEYGLVVQSRLDMMFFKEKTIDNVVVMGKNTFNSLGNPNGLSNRLNIVLSSSGLECGDNVIVVANIDELLSIIARQEKDVFIIGGKHLYESKELLSVVDGIYVTHFYDIFVDAEDKDNNIVMSPEFLIHLSTMLITTEKIFDDVNCVGVVKLYKSVFNDQERDYCSARS